MIDDGDCGEIGGLKIGRGNRSTRRKPAPGPLCPPQIRHDQTLARTRAAAVGSQRLTALPMTRPHTALKCNTLCSLTSLSLSLSTYGSLVLPFRVRFLCCSESACICSLMASYFQICLEPSALFYRLKMFWKLLNWAVIHTAPAIEDLSSSAYLNIPCY
jgi:hypothetical protein